MLTLVDRPESGTSRTASPETTALSGSGYRTLKAGEILFREGEARTHVYRVESGSICLFRERADGEPEVVEFAFPGDLVGLGYLDKHVTGAQASVETSLSCLPRAVIEPLMEKGAADRSRLTEAIAREVAFLKETQGRPRLAAPLTRVAALFVTLARLNAYEGRDPAVLTDSLTCGVVADYLNMSIDDLAHWLRELEARDLVEPALQGLRLKDRAALEKLADATD
jgi:CRP/FNR family transcriptional regulator